MSHLRHRLLLLFVLTSFALGLLLGGSVEAVPIPSPTKADEEASHRLTVKGEALILGNNLEQAKAAATLDAYRALLTQAQSKWGFGTQLELKPDQSRRFTIDDRHPNDRLLGWIFRAELKNERRLGKKLELTFQSPPVGEISSANPFLLNTTTHDVDGDGIPDVVGAGYDGRVYVFKKAKAGLVEMGHTRSYASLTTEIRADSTGSIWSHIKSARLNDIVKVEAAGKGQARVVARISMAESVGDRLLGEGSEQREIVVRLHGNQAPPEVSIEEPFDFSSVTDPRSELRGRITSTLGLQKAEFFVNETRLFSSPGGFKSQKLDLALEPPLEIGWNRLSVTAQDQKRQTTHRELLVRRNGPVTNTLTHRALLISTDPAADLTPLGKALIDGGQFPAENVKVVTGAQAQLDVVTGHLQAMAEQPRSVIFLYFEGRTQPSVRGGYEQLLFGGGKLDSRSWKELLGAHRTLAVFNTLMTRPKGRNWLDHHLFLEELGRQGWLALGFDAPDSKAQGEFRSTLLELFKKGGGKSNLEGDELYPYLSQKLTPRYPHNPLCRGLLVGRPSLGSF